MKLNNADLSTGSSARTFPGPRIVIGAGLVSAACAALVIWRPDHVTLANAGLAGATGLLALVPLFVYLARREWPGSTVFALTGLYYLVFYALPVFLFSPGHWPSGVDATGTEYGLRVANIGVEAQLVVFLGLAALIAAYYACRIPIQNRLPFIRLPAAAPERLRPLLWALLAAHLAYVFIPALSAIPSIGQFLLPVGPLAAGMLLVLSHRGKLPRGEWLLIAIVIAMIFFRIIATGLLTEVVLFCGFLAAALHHAGSRWCWFYAVLPFVIVAALYSPVNSPLTKSALDTSGLV